MAQNLTKRGDFKVVPNTGAAVKSGDLVKYGTNGKGFAVNDIDANATGTVAKLSSDIYLKKTADSVAISAGDKVYGAHATKTCNKTAASRVYLGVAYTSSAANSTNGVWVELHPNGS